MKVLSDILRGVTVQQAIGPIHKTVDCIAFDSRQVQPSCLFVAVKGVSTDGHNFINTAINSGASVIVCEVIPENLDSFSNVTFIQVSDSSLALGAIASNWYNNPSGDLKLVGITGTNGKTTSVTLLFNLFRELGYHAGILSTIRNQVDDEIIPATHTTPDALQLNRLLRLMADRGCEYCFMEVSSHAIVQNRIAGLTFTGGIFSNITHDHLDFHKTFDGYLKAKKKFFDDLPSGSFALTNIDDKNGRVMVQNTRAQVKSYSIRGIADFKGRILETPIDGIHMEFNGSEAWCRLVGKFNCYNLLAVYGTALLLGQDSVEVLTALSKLGSVEGRFDYLKSPDGIIGIVDYAHTPDALQNVLETIRDLRRGSETLITVVGCGGDRDKTKRPVMARIAAQMSDRVIITSDNPRSEEPESIIKEMLKGVEPADAGKVLSITDRLEAIRAACAFAGNNDIILVAGKGHEKYQEIKGVKYPFDDKKILQEILG